MAHGRAFERPGTAFAAATTGLSLEAVTVAPHDRVVLGALQGDRRLVIKTIDVARLPP